LPRYLWHINGKVVDTEKASRILQKTWRDWLGVPEGFGVRDTRQVAATWYKTFLPPTLIPPEARVLEDDDPAVAAFHHRAAVHNREYGMWEEVQGQVTAMLPRFELFSKSIADMMGIGESPPDVLPKPYWEVQAEERSPQRMAEKMVPYLRDAIQAQFDGIRREIVNLEHSFIVTRAETHDFIEHTLLTGVRDIITNAQRPRQTSTPPANASWNNSFLPASSPDTRATSVSLGASAACARPPSPADDDIDAPPDEMERDPFAGDATDTRATSVSLGASAASPRPLSPADDALPAEMERNPVASSDTYDHGYSDAWYNEAAEAITALEDRNRRGALKVERNVATDSEPTPRSTKPAAQNNVIDLTHASSSDIIELDTSAASTPIRGRKRVRGEQGAARSVSPPPAASKRRIRPPQGYLVNKESALAVQRNKPAARLQPRASAVAGPSTPLVQVSLTQMEDPGRHADDPLVGYVAARDARAARRDKGKRKADEQIHPPADSDSDDGEPAELVQSSLTQLLQTPAIPFYPREEAPLPAKDDLKGRLIHTLSRFPTAPNGSGPTVVVPETNEEVESLVRRECRYSLSRILTHVLGHVPSPEELRFREPGMEDDLVEILLGPAAGHETGSVHIYPTGSGKSFLWTITADVLSRWAPVNATPMVCLVIFPYAMLKIDQGNRMDDLCRKLGLRCLNSGNGNESWHGTAHDLVLLSMEALSQEKMTR
jgi:hypothetical protein